MFLTILTSPILSYLSFSHSLTSLIPLTSLIIFSHGSHNSYIPHISHGSHIGHDSHPSQGHVVPTFTVLLEGSCELESPASTVASQIVTFSLANLITKSEKGRKEVDDLRLEWIKHLRDQRSSIRRLNKRQLQGGIESVLLLGVTRLGKMDRAPRCPLPPVHSGVTIVTHLLWQSSASSPFQEGMRIGKRR